MPAATPKLPSIVQLQVVRVTKHRIKKEQNHWPDSLLSTHELRGWKLASAALMRSLCSTRLLPNSALRLDNRAGSINPHPGHLSASAHAGDDPPHRSLPNYLRIFSRRPGEGIAGRCLPALFSPKAPKNSPRRGENAQKVAGILRKTPLTWPGRRV